MDWLNEWVDELQNGISLQTPKPVTVDEWPLLEQCMSPPNILNLVPEFNPTGLEESEEILNLIWEMVENIHKSNESLKSSSPKITSLTEKSCCERKTLKKTKWEKKKSFEVSSKISSLRKAPEKPIDTKSFEVPSKISSLRKPIETKSFEVPSKISSSLRKAPEKPIETKISSLNKVPEKPFEKKVSFLKTFKIPKISSLNKAPEKPFETKVSFLKTFKIPKISSLNKASEKPFDIPKYSSPENSSLQEKLLDRKKIVSSSGKPKKKSDLKHESSYFGPDDVVVLHPDPEDYTYILKFLL